MTFSYMFKAPWLVAEFETQQRMLSWSITHPGFCENDRVAWLEVKNADLNPNVEPLDYLQDKLNHGGLRGALGLMTSRDMKHHHKLECSYGSVTANCLMTLGLSNGVHVGFPNQDKRLSKVGTINALCSINEPLGDGAMIEATSIATQARTAALLDFYRNKFPEKQAVSGTGTDCIVIASPTKGSKEIFAGLHTHVGKAIGQVVYEVTMEAAASWHKSQTN